MIPRGVQCAKKALSDSLGLVDFAIGLANSALNLQLPLARFTLALKKTWKGIMSLKSPWKLKHCGISLKKITFVKKSVLCKGKIESTAVPKFYWWSWKCVCSWFQCSHHSSFPIIWSTLVTVPFWGKDCNDQTPLQLRILKVFTACHAMSNYRGKKSLKKLS